MISRRGVLSLAAVTVAGLAGCSTGPSGDKGASGGVGKTEDPDTAVLAEAVADTRALMARYDDAPASIRKKIIALRADHQAHLEALGATTMVTPTPSASDTPSPGPSALSDLAAAEKTAADRRVDQCKRAQSADLARLLASIGGCEAAHAKALDDLGSGA